MRIVTLDFETYYAKDIGFRTQTTEEYIRDKRFEVIGVGIKVEDAPIHWFSGTREELRKQLLTYSWRDSALLCHNTLFDGAVLKWHFNISPAMYMDTLCMARALHGIDVGGSLEALAVRYNIGVKGDEVEDAIGKKRLDFSTEELQRYGEYCKNDVDLTYKLFNIFNKSFPVNEMTLIDLTLRMFIHPVLRVDDCLLVKRLEDIKKEKSELLNSLKEKLGCEDEESVRKKLASNPQFAGVLVSLGIEPPMKESLTTKKQTYALAKNDEGFIKLTEHLDSFIQQLCAVRLGTKSTMEESRIERFIDMGKRNKGTLPVPLKYYGAHTGRWAGLDKVNFQNLPSRDKKKKALKNAVVAPEGYIIINCDSSQIEARVLAWLAGQTDLVEAFAQGRDVYCEFAAKVYETPISKEANPVERFVGKTCILGLGYGTGALKLQHTLKTQPPGAKLTEIRCKEIVDLYRTENSSIPKLWAACDFTLNDLCSWPDKKAPYYLSNNHAVRVYPGEIRLPNNLSITYPSLAIEDGGMSYMSRKGKTKIWGGTVVENVVQALSRIVIGEQMIKLSVKYRPVLTVHDAAVIVVPEDEVVDAVKFITEIMSVAPSWAVGLPVACEAKYAYSYGNC